NARGSPSTSVRSHTSTAGSLRAANRRSRTCVGPLRCLRRGHRSPHGYPRTGQTCAVVYDFDIAVIGSGPAGQRAAVQAAKLGRSVVLVERRAMVGGVCVNTGTIPSKTLREAVVYLTGMSQREMYGQSYRVKADITMDDLRERTNRVIAREIDVIRSQ